MGLASGAGALLGVFVYLHIPEVRNIAKTI
jgi:hypothetical protein